MRHSTLLISCAALAVACGAPAGSAQDRSTLAPNAKDRQEIASSIYRDCYAQTLQILVSPPAGTDAPAAMLNGKKAEELYQWSRRWMEAERDLKPDGGSPNTALKGHLDRMKKLEEGELFKDLAKERRILLKDGEAAQTMAQFAAFTKSLKFFRLEAESWISKTP